MGCCFDIIAAFMVPLNEGQPNIGFVHKLTVQAPNLPVWQLQSGSAVGGQCWRTPSTAMTLSTQSSSVLYSVRLSIKTGTHLWAHASHASRGVHSHWAPHVWMSCGETARVQLVRSAALFRSIIIPQMRRKHSHSKANMRSHCRLSAATLKYHHMVCQYLEVWWGPGCLARGAVTRGCSQEADLACGGRALGHLGTVETWMAAGRTQEGQWGRYFRMIMRGILVMILARWALKAQK